MNMFARFDENPANTLQDIKKNKTLRTDRRTIGRRDNVKTVYPTTNKVCGGYKNYEVNSHIPVLDIAKNKSALISGIAEIRL